MLDAFRRRLARVLLGQAVAALTSEASQL